MRTIANPFANTGQVGYRGDPAAGPHNLEGALPNPVDTIINNPFGRAMTEMGVEYTKNLINKPFWQKIWNIEGAKYYFDVTNRYVLRKVGVLLAPFLYRGEWRRSSTEITDEHNGFASAKNELHAFDLYIPSVSFITFILVICLNRGIGKNFNPEYIGNYWLRCSIITGLEVLSYKIAFILCGVKNASIGDILALSSYKYLGLALTASINILVKGFLVTLILFYVGFASAFFTFKSIQRFAIQTTTTQEMSIGTFRLSVLNLVCLAGQVIFTVMLWFFTS